MRDVKQVTDEKIARLRAAINLESHDQVPVAAMADLWPVRYSKKYSMQDAFYHVDFLAECYKEAFSEWNSWDAFNIAWFSLGPLLDAIGSKRYSAPGRDLPANAEFQHPDLTLMSAKEYPELIQDPVKFQIEVILPRLCDRLSAQDSMIRTKALIKAALYYAQLGEKVRSYNRLWQEGYGIPLLFQRMSIYVPIDWIADKLRGFQNTLIDIKERPDEVQAACEALLPFILQVVLSTAPGGTDFPLIFNPQHVSPFISPKDYGKVYWPPFKKILDEVTERGYRVWMLLENNQEQHLERLQDLPRGKVVANIEGTDLVKVKKALGGKVCIAGGMPTRLLSRGTPEQVKERTLSILKLFEDEPGFIMSADTPIPTSAKPENLHAWLDTMREHGRLSKVGPPPPKEESPWKANENEARLSKPGTAKTGAAEKVPFTVWESIKPGFGRIEGDERIIKETWDEQEKLLLLFIFSLIR